MSFVPLMNNNHWNQRWVTHRLVSKHDHIFLCVLVSSDQDCANACELCYLIAVNFQKTVYLICMIFKDRLPLDWWSHVKELMIASCFIICHGCVTGFQVDRRELKIGVICQQWFWLWDWKDGGSMGNVNWFIQYLGSVDIVETCPPKGRSVVSKDNFKDLCLLFPPILN